MRFSIYTLYIVYDAGISSLYVVHLTFDTAGTSTLNYIIVE